MRVTALKGHSAFQTDPIFRNVKICRESTSEIQGMLEKLDVVKVEEMTVRPAVSLSSWLHYIFNPTAINS